MTKHSPKTIVRYEDENVSVIEAPAPTFGYVKVEQGEHFQVWEAPNGAQTVFPLHPKIPVLVRNYFKKRRV